MLRRFEKHKFNIYYSQPRGFLLSRVKKIRTHALCVISGRHRGAGWTKEPSESRPVDATFQNL